LNKKERNLLALDIPTGILRKMYRTMVKTRKFEEKVAGLIEDGEIKCPCHLYIGEEAVAVGVYSALRKDNFVFSAHRSHGHYIAKGGDIKKLMAEIYCKSTGIKILILWPKPTHKHESLGLGHFHPSKTEQISTEVLSLPMYPQNINSSGEN